jgi:electron transfer flavoprotein beta subunit
MKALVAAKRVIDANVRIQIRADGSGVETAGAKMAMNPFDLIALEEALRLREKGQVSEIVLVSIGPGIAQDTLRSGLAMGADRAILVDVNGRIEPPAIARLLKAVAEEEQPGIILMGKQAIDSDASQTGQMLGALLGWPQATFASEILLADGKARVVREVDAGLQTLELALPAVITTDLRLNSPRYASLPNIMKAKSKPLVVRSAAEFGVDIRPRLQIVSTKAPPARGRGAMLLSTAELADVIKSQLNRN